MLLRTLYLRYQTAACNPFIQPTGAMLFITVSQLAACMPSNKHHCPFPRLPNFASHNRYSNGRGQTAGSSNTSPLMTSPTPRRKLNGLPFDWSNTLRLEVRRPMYWTNTRLPALASLPFGFPNFNSSSSKPFSHLSADADPGVVGQCQEVK